MTIEREVKGKNRKITRDNAPIGTVYSFKQFSYLELDFIPTTIEVISNDDIKVEASTIDKPVILRKEQINDSRLVPKIEQPNGDVVRLFWKSSK